MDSKLNSVSYDSYMSMGSGSVSAYGELETGYKDGLTLEEAKQLAIKGITAGILQDLGSGSNVDLCILTREKTEYLRNHVKVGRKMVVQENLYNLKRNNIRKLNRGSEDS